MIWGGDYFRSILPSTIRFPFHWGRSHLQVCIHHTTHACSTTPKQIFHPEDRDFQLGDTLKNEVWVNPLAVYMSADFEEEEEGEGEEEEGGDDGDDGGEEEEEGGDEGGKEQEG